MTRRRHTDLMRRYGISHDDYEQMVKDQDGKCLICGGPPTVGRTGKPCFAVDHNHDTGEVRGLLCNGCNIKLHAIEDEQFYASAHIYLYNRDSRWAADLLEQQLEGL